MGKGRIPEESALTTLPNNLFGRKDRTGVLVVRGFGA